MLSMLNSREWAAVFWFFFFQTEHVGEAPAAPRRDVVDLSSIHVYPVRDAEALLPRPRSRQSCPWSAGHPRHQGRLEAQGKRGACRAAGAGRVPTRRDKGTVSVEGSQYITIGEFLLNGPCAAGASSGVQQRFSSVPSEVSGDAQMPPVGGGNRRASAASDKKEDKEYIMSMSRLLPEGSIDASYGDERPSSGLGGGGL